ncbi:MAG: hypothetical protein WDN44_14250 [Sphingomonas sp.]
MQIAIRSIWHFWPLNIAAAALAVFGLRWHEIDIAAIIGNLVLLLIWIKKTIETKFQMDISGISIPIEKIIGIFSTFLFWIPIYIITLVPHVQYKLAIYAIIFCISLGGCGIFIAQIPFSKITRLRP